MSDGATLIDPSGIPHFIGDLSTLDTDVMLLTANAAQFRASGANVHTTFQGLSAFYHAPEAGELLSSTRPVKAKAGAFADGLEKVAAALSDYSAEVQPLVERLATLKADATAFVQSLSGDDDWRKDQDKVDRNNALWRDVNHTVAAFQAAERACHNKITALVGGSKITVDDGSHGQNMYGYRADDLDHAGETPWGAPAEREYEGWDWLTHQAGQVWDGIWTDGVMATVHGVGTLFGADGSGAAGEAWKGLARLATASALTSATLGTWWLVPDDKLPSWLRDSRTTYKQTVKGFVAWDTWKTNPSRAAGAVGFNVLTVLGTEGVGSAAGAGGRAGAAARALSTAGKVGRAMDPMTYVGKAGELAFVKVGDTFRALKDLHSGTTLDLLERADALRSPRIPDNAIPYVDNATGDLVYLTDEGHLLNEDGSLHQPVAEAPHELSANDRSELHKGAQTDRSHELSAAGARGGDHSPGTAQHSQGGAAASHGGDEHSPRGPEHDTGAVGDHTPTGHGNDGHGHADGTGDGTQASGGTGASAGSGGFPSHHRGVWPARSDIPGPAAGEELKRPHARHTISGAAKGEIKEKNSLILRGHSNEIDQDIAAIAEGRAKLTEDGNRYEINGRTYGVEPGGRVYPDSGPGIVNLDRNEYAALQQLVRAKGDISAAPQLTRNPRFVNNPQAVQKALDIYHGTYR
ncbi:hypothetical protein [Streptomyces sp. NPDC002588]|uniref:hypothetical protein n=1 Tax=Streptomyces sp. NPDC002588 TaxID=3154419 RepID=UPI00331E4FC8